MEFKSRNITSYGFLGVGALLLVYFMWSNDPYRPYVGVVGFVVIMIGLYFLSQKVGKKPTMDSFVISEEIEENDKSEEDTIEKG